MFLKRKQSGIGGNFYQSNDGPEAHTLISPEYFGGPYQSSDTTQKFAGQISNGDFIVIRYIHVISISIMSITIIAVQKNPDDQHHL